MKFAYLGLLLALGVGQVTVSCAGKKKTHVGVPALPAPSKFFVHGDPKEMIQGTTTDKSGLTDLANMPNLDGYALSGYFVLAQVVENETVKPITNQTELEEENSTSDNGPRFVSNYSFEKVNGRYVYSDKRPEAKDYPTFSFNDIDGKLQIKTMSDFPVEVVHYSVKPDNEAFSLLLSAQDEESGKMLIAVYFVKTKAVQVPVRKVEQGPNYFVDGDGIAIPWKRPLNFDVCGTKSAVNKMYIDKALSDWSKAGKFATGMIGNQPYTVTVKADARPFSDLNQNCVNFVDQYKMEDQDNLAVYGITLTIIDHSDQEILNSSVFIFKNALTRGGESPQPTVTHEIGHSLGLGHAFGTALKPAPGSIMGYEGVGVLTDADKAVIASLYPATTAEVTNALPASN